jgi:hypothetical protein
MYINYIYVINRYKCIENYSQFVSQYSMIKRTQLTRSHSLGSNIRFLLIMWKSNTNY